MDSASAIAAVDVVARETALFAAAGFLIGGIDDLCADLLYFAFARRPRVPVAAGRPLRFAVMVPAWDEANVIEPMLAAMMARIGDHDVRVYVGTYPNDPATGAAVARAAATDARIRPVVGRLAGPTTKGCNLNTIWRALTDEERTSGWRADAIVLHVTGQ